jgi:predicted Zn-dependent peptidase
MKKSLWDPFADFRKHVLSNGLMLYYAHWNRTWFRICFEVHVGSLTDPSGKEGTAHFLEHLLCENVAGFSREKIKNFFSETGGYAKLGATNIYSNSYEFKIPANEITLKKALAIFGKMIINTQLNADIEVERKIILREFREAYPIDELYERTFLRKYKMLFHGTSFVNFNGNMGVPETISSIVKQDLQDFHDMYYVPQNMSVVMLGGIPYEDALSVFENSVFGKPRKGLINSQLKKLSEVSLPLEAGHCLRLSEYLKDSSLVDSSYFETNVLLPGALNSEKVSILVDMLNILLYEEMREKLGGSYNFSADYENVVEVLRIWICGKIDPGLVDETEKITAACISKIAEKEKLFQRVKKEQLNRFYMRDYDGSRLCEIACKDIMRYRRIISLEEAIKDVKKVTFEDICELAQYILPQERRWTYIQRP